MQYTAHQRRQEELLAINPRRPGQRMAIHSLHKLQRGQGLSWQSRIRRLQTWRSGVLLWFPVLVWVAVHLPQADKNWAGCTTKTVVLMGPGLLGPSARL